MSRRLSWLDRLDTITHTVESSSRSYYGRKDLQQLFEVQPRSAQKLMASMPVVQVGNAHLVERDALGILLRRLSVSENPTEVLARLRSRPPKPSRRKLRPLSLQDASVDLDTLPKALTLSPGVMTVRFKTMDQLAETMVFVATLLQNHLEGFASRFEAPAEAVEEETDLPLEQR